MRWTRIAAVAGAALIAMLAAAAAQQEGRRTDPPPGPPPPAAEGEAGRAEAPASEPSAGEPAEQPTSQEKLNELLRRRDEGPRIEPMRSGGGGGARNGSPAAPPMPRLDGGTAPPTARAGRAAPLRREGAFVLTRRGRMVRAPGDSRAWLFVFESEGAGGDPPMYLMPCRLLEDMETIVDQHADGAVFVLSGEIYAYRGANYLLPTLVKLAPDRGNLEP